jgi:hypothetical protein
MLLLPLIIHLLNNLSKDAYVVEYEGERRSGTSTLGSEYAGGVCVSFTRTYMSGRGGKVPKALE